MCGTKKVRNLKDENLIFRFHALMLASRNTLILSHRSNISLHLPVQSTSRSQHSHEAAANPAAIDMGAFEMDDEFTAIRNPSGLMTVAGFGSLLSKKSAMSTFPDLVNFRPGRLRGWRRIFTHTADIFFKRGIARPDTREIASLSCEPCPDADLVISLFEVPHTVESVSAFITREHEFRFCAVDPLTMDWKPEVNKAVLCARNTDEEYFTKR